MTGGADTSGNTSRLVEITLDEKSVGRKSSDVEHERKVAIFDLLEDNVFALEGREEGKCCRTHTQHRLRRPEHPAIHVCLPVPCWVVGAGPPTTPRHDQRLSNPDTRGREIPDVPSVRCETSAPTGPTRNDSRHRRGPDPVSSARRVTGGK